MRLLHVLLWLTICGSLCGRQLVTKGSGKIVLMFSNLVYHGFSVRKTRHCFNMNTRWIQHVILTTTRSKMHPVSSYYCYFLAEPWFGSTINLWLIKLSKLYVTGCPAFVIDQCGSLASNCIIYWGIISVTPWEPVVVVSLAVWQVYPLFATLQKIDVTC